VLRQVLRKRGLTQTQLAERIGRDKPYVSRVLSGSYPIGVNFALDLERGLGAPSAEWWMTVQTDWAVHKARQEQAS